MRKTKIICTIGPASSDEKTLEELCLAGMNVCRMNFSHGDHAEQIAKIRNIKAVRERLGLPIAMMLDTKGPEYRIRTFRQEPVQIPEGGEFTFTTDDVEGDETIVSVSHKALHEDVKPGDRILVNNGLLIFEVERIEGHNVVCRTIAGGTLGNRKSMSFPNRRMSGAYLSEQDKADIQVGIDHGVDFIAASFVSCAQDVLDIKEYLNAHGGGDIEVIAKIENRAGVDNIEEICEVCDGIMVARGDLGIEIPFVELPAIQKKLITKCRLLGKRVITATEMLESMIQNPRPTRAEISDVANAVYDGTSAIMLSGETAYGKYPVLALKSMAQIAEYTEQQIHYRKRFRNNEFQIHSTLDAISHATCAMAIDVDAKGIVACTLSGRTARMVSRFRCPTDIIGLTTDVKVWRKLALSWAVTPVLTKEFHSLDVMFYHAVEAARKVLDLRDGDTVVLTGGQMNGRSGNTNTIKVETVGE